MEYDDAADDTDTDTVKQKIHIQKPDNATPTMLSLESHSLQVMPLFPHSVSSILVDLNISRNSLKELPDAIGDLVALEHLNCSRNQIRVLPPTLGNLHKLKSLNCLSNSLRPYIRSLPLDELVMLATDHSLKSLDLRYNEKIRGPAMESLAKIMPTSVDIQVTIPVPKLLLKDGNKTRSDAAVPVLHACDRDATQLQSQLEPWSTPHLRKRLEQVFGQPATDPETVHRDEIMAKLLALYNTNCARNSIGGQPRRVQCFRGQPVDQKLCEALLRELKAWAIRYGSRPRERPTINAQVYMILRSPAEFSEKNGAKANLAAQKVEQNQQLWELAHEAMLKTDPVFAEQYTALAVTGNFTGSPHIDTQNVGPFYGMALGDFSEGGGALCVELDPMTVAAVDTRNRLGKVDGRFPHWVAPYEGERFSLIYYQTLGKQLPMTCAVYSEPCTSASTTNVNINTESCSDARDAALEAGTTS
jgi:hypothetical protein